MVNVNVNVNQKEIKNQNVHFYSDMGHIMYYPINNIPETLLDTIYNEYIDEYINIDNNDNISTRHYRLKKNIDNVQIVIN